MLENVNLCLVIIYIIIHRVLPKKTTITIVHVNDFHGHLEEFGTETWCTSADKGKDCYGGLPRLSQAVQHLRDKDTNLILLNAGDEFHGTMWDKMFKHGHIKLVSQLKYDVVALGSNDFDDIDDLKNTIEEWKNNSHETHFLLSNIDTATTTCLPQLEKSYIKEISGKKIGFLGYTSTKTKITSKSGTCKLHFTDEVEGLKKEVQKLKSEKVSIIIAVGHAGLDIDKKIAEEIPEIDIVVGGNSETFMYNGTPPVNSGDKKPSHTYPLVVTREHENTALVVQDYRFAKYLGYLSVTFDHNNNNIVSWKGNPILLDGNKVNRDTVNEMDKYIKKLRETRASTVCHARVNLSNAFCDRRECGLGNILLDAVRDKFQNENLSRPLIAVWNAGAIVEGILQGNVTYEEVINTYRYANNTVDVYIYSGEDIRKMMEHSFKSWKSHGFLQVSGMRVTYDETNNANKKVTSIEFCGDCKSPGGEEIENSKEYYVVLSTHLARGGDEYTMLNKADANRITRQEFSHQDIILDHLKKNELSYESNYLDGRIKIVGRNKYELTIMHVNDLHSHFNGINKAFDKCSAGSGPYCYGGIARLYSAIHDIQAKHDNVLHIIGGDAFQGSLWFNLFKWKPYLQILNQLAVDAMALGIYEFDAGIHALVKLLDNTDTAFISCNIYTRDESQLTHRLARSTVVEKGGVKIGIVGYTTTETPAVSSPGDKLKFEPEYQCIRDEVRRFLQRDIKIIVAVGDSGIEVDKKIAEHVEGVDVVVGGRTNTLYNGPAPHYTDMDEKEGEYPLVVTGVKGRKVLVVQDYKFVKYLGKLTVTFDQDGEMLSHSGNAVLLDDTFPPNSYIKTEMKDYEKEIQSKGNEVLVYSRSNMKEMYCKTGQCALGNLAADAFRWQFDKTGEGGVVTFISGGAVRADLASGRVTYKDLVNVFPYEHTVVLYKIKGADMKEALEHGVSNEEVEGAFLQVSGLRVKYNMSEPSGQRVDAIRICRKCDALDSGEALATNNLYYVALPTFLKRGGNGHRTLRYKTERVDPGAVASFDRDIITSYVKTLNELDEKMLIDCRMIINGKSGHRDCPDISAAATAKININIITTIITSSSISLLYIKNY